MHKNGKIARFARIFEFKEFLHSEECGIKRADVLKRECEIKKIIREKKLKLIVESRI